MSKNKEFIPAYRCNVVLPFSLMKDCNIADIFWNLWPLFDKGLFVFKKKIKKWLLCVHLSVFILFLETLFIWENLKGRKWALMSSKCQHFPHFSFTTKYRVDWKTDTIGPPPGFPWQSYPFHLAPSHMTLTYQLSSSCWVM